MGQGLTSDKHVSLRSSKVVRDECGITHASILVDKMPPDYVRKIDFPPIPFIVRMCDLLEAYDKATSWRDFIYPTTYLDVESEFEGYPTCVRCSGV